MAAERFGPAWLLPLLGAKFFVSCPAHRGMSRSERNHYCLTCAADADAETRDAAACCQWCVAASHPSAGEEGIKRHVVVQVRRSSYHDVVRVSELEAASLDLTRVQTYVINRDRVVFLNARPKAPRNGKCAAAAAAAVAECEACGRGLLDVAFRFCSLGCKLECLESDPTLTFTIDPNNMPEPQISGPIEGEEEDDDDNDDELFCLPGKKMNAGSSKQQVVQPSPSASRPKRSRQLRQVMATDGDHNKGAGGVDGMDEKDREAADTIIGFAGKMARKVPAASAADPHSFRRRARKGAHRAPQRSPFY